VNLRDIGEGALIRKIRERFALRPLPPPDRSVPEARRVKAGEVHAGIGDDAAVFDLPPGYSAVFCSDLLAENTHFLRNLHPPDSVGYKSIAANVSDVAAMGGIPMHFLISLAAPGDLDFSWIEGFLDGVERACRDFEISLLGGDSSSAGSIFVDVSMIGRVRSSQAIRRSGAKSGDAVYVTGRLGSSALGLRLLKTGTLDDPAVRRHLYPEPRHRIGPAVADQAHAMIDISDGLSTDLAHIVAESKVCARIYKDRLPAAPGVQEHDVLHGGEEYELIIIANDLPAMIEGIPITCVGEIIDSDLDNQVFLIDGTQESVLLPSGWQHFSG